MPESKYRWHRQTIAETFERILNGTTPWVAIGDFLDDWRRSAIEDRSELAETPIAEASTLEMLRLGSLLCLNGRAALLAR